MTPKPSACSKGNVAYLICKSKDCLQNPFVCGGECECQVKHRNCDVKNWEQIKLMFTTKKEYQSRYKEMEVIHKQLSDTIEKLNKQFGRWKEENVSKKTEKLVEIIKGEGDRDEDLSGNMIYEVFEETELQKEQESMIRKKHQNIINLTQTIIKELTAIKYIEHLRIDSKIVKEVEVLQSFFNESFKSIRLLYRASDNNFGIKQFHECCDGVPNTMLLLQTQFGRVVGGFTPIPWTSKQALDKVGDQSMKSFLFSYTLKQKLNFMRFPAVCHKATDGPVFGINDLKISNSAREGYGMFNRQYNSIKNYGDTQSTYTLFTGRPDGYSFKIKDWEVFQIELLE